MLDEHFSKDLLGLFNVWYMVRSCVTWFKYLYYCAFTLLPQMHYSNAHQITIWFTKKKNYHHANRPRNKHRNSTVLSVWMYAKVSAECSKLELMSLQKVCCWRNSYLSQLNRLYEVETYNSVSCETTSWTNKTLRALRKSVGNAQKSKMLGRLRVRKMPDWSHYVALLLCIPSYLYPFPSSQISIWISSWCSVA